MPSKPCLGSDQDVGLELVHGLYFLTRHHAANREIEGFAELCCSTHDLVLLDFSMDLTKVYISRRPQAISPFNILFFLDF